MCGANAIWRYCDVAAVDSTLGRVQGMREARHLDQREHQGNVLVGSLAGAPSTLDEIQQQAGKAQPRNQASNALRPDSSKRGDFSALDSDPGSQDTRALDYGTPVSNLRTWSATGGRGNPIDVAGSGMKSNFLPPLSPKFSAILKHEPEDERAEKT